MNLTKIMKAMEAVVDKFAHVGIGALVGSATYVAARYFGLSDFAARGASAGTVFAVALVREIYNERKVRGSFSPADIGATMVGWVTVAVTTQAA